jgi:hypothetical protein
MLGELQAMLGEMKSVRNRFQALARFDRALSEIQDQWNILSLSLDDQLHRLRTLLSVTLDAGDNLAEAMQSHGGQQGRELKQALKKIREKPSSLMASLCNGVP